MFSCDGFVPLEKCWFLSKLPKPGVEFLISKNLKMGNLYFDSKKILKMFSIDDFFISFLLKLSKISPNIENRVLNFKKFKKLKFWSLSEWKCSACFTIFLLSRNVKIEFVILMKLKMENLRIDNKKVYWLWSFPRFYPG